MHVVFLSNSIFGVNVKIAYQIYANLLYTIKLCQKQLGRNEASVNL